jgi:hypothetical protein
LRCVAFEYAKKEKADITFKEARFNFIEIQSPQYHLWRILATVFSTSGKMLLIPFTLVLFQYWRSSEHSLGRSILFSLVMVLPMINLFI